MAATTAGAPGSGGAYNNNAGGYGGGHNEKPFGGHHGNNGYHGTMHPANGFGPHSDDPVSYQRYFTKIANPGPMGLYSFAYSTFLWSFYLVHTRGVQVANVMIAVGLFVGGLVQFLAGMWEFPRGNVFGSTIFTMYAAFYFSYAIILFPGAGITSGSTPSSQINNAIGLYYMVWAIITFLFGFVVLRRSISFILLFFFWFLTYLMLAISQWTTRSASSFSDAGGAFGFITAIVALYIATSQLIRSELAWGFTMPLGHIGQRVGRGGAGTGGVADNGGAGGPV